VANRACALLKDRRRGPRRGVAHALAPSADHQVSWAAPCTRHENELS